VEAEPVVLDRARTIEKLARLTAEAAAAGARLVVFPETFVPAYPSSVWARALAGWADPGAKAAFAQLARESVAIPGPDERRLGEVARDAGEVSAHSVTAELAELSERLEAADAELAGLRALLHSLQVVRRRRRAATPA
jgi:hypothetical protein